MEVFIFNVFLSFMGYLPVFLISCAIAWYINSRYKKGWNLKKWLPIAAIGLLIATAIHPTNTPKNQVNKVAVEKIIPQQSDKVIVQKESIIEEVSKGKDEFDKMVDWKSKVEEK